jgi:hypothetical protein
MEATGASVEEAKMIKSIHDRGSATSVARGVGSFKS